MNGVLIIDKPSGMTSHDVVNRVRRIAQERAVGHLGTLDPMATGVLPLVLGKMTRLAQFYLHTEKRYEGTICFGFATDTYDAEGERIGEIKRVGFGQEDLDAALAGFRGEIEQMPPPFSAKKIKGVPAYKLARKKEDVELKSVRVTVKEFEVSDFRTDEAGLGFAKFAAQVSSGTYVRSLAHDLGEQLGTGAHLQSLRRTQVGEFGVVEAHGLDALADRAANGTLPECLLHPRQLLPEIPSVTATEDQMAKIRHGNAVNLADLGQSKLIKVFRGQGELVAVASRVAGTLFQPKIVLVGE
ncbi:MAG: tRNA pseudouridine synthase [Acidobacteriales bacterium]|nr:tRNA pseudouridine synthase [Terriglobales bacterium]